MTRNVIWQDHEPTVQPVDETIDHLRGSPAGRLILEYGDYECPYSRQAFRAIERVKQELGGGVRFCFRHFPLTGIQLMRASTVVDSMISDSTTKDAEIDSWKPKRPTLRLMMRAPSVEAV
jgi:hypothetical protein